MPDTDERIITLLEQLVELQKATSERQLQMMQRTEQYYADTRQRTEHSIGLQQTAVKRQRAFVWVWLSVVAVLLSAAFGLISLIQYR